MKRLVDTEIWKKEWFRKLAPAEKEAWRWITDNCDNVGVWKPDTESAEFHIGAKVDWESLVSHCNGNIEKLGNGKWWLTGFVEFQHKDLFRFVEKPDNGKRIPNPYQSYVELLLHHGLYERYPQLFDRFGVSGEPIPQALGRPWAGPDEKSAGPDGGISGPGQALKDDFSGPAQAHRVREKEREKERVLVREKEEEREPGILRLFVEKIAGAKNVRRSDAKADIS